MTEIKFSGNHLQKTMAGACIKFNNGTISPNSAEQFFEYQLPAEGIKRIESFYFEIILTQRLMHSPQPQDPEYSVGWLVGFDRDSNPAYWFRCQENTDDWNAVDQALLERLSRPTPGAKFVPRVLRITYYEDLNCFYSSSNIEGQWTNNEKLVSALHNLANKRPARSIRNTREEHFDDTRYELAVKWLRTLKTEELKKLSIHRHLINAFLAPILGSQIVDIDTLALTRGNELHYIEFKRKYPSKDKKHFGLDIYPHVKLIEYLKERNVFSQHLILVAPFWNKHISPLAMLSKKQNHDDWRWIAAKLSTTSFGDIDMKTAGTDSGHSDENRKQATIKWSELFVIHEGLKLGCIGRQQLCAFFNNDRLEGVKPASYQYLERLRKDF